MFIHVLGLQEENRSGEKRLLEGLGSIQSESSVKGMSQYIIFVSKSRFYTYIIFSTVKL